MKAILHCFGLAHLPVENHLGCMVMIEMPEIGPNRTSKDENDLNKWKKHACRLSFKKTDLYR